jgi:hypothetical protein
MSAPGQKAAPLFLRRNALRLLRPAVALPIAELPMATIREMVAGSRRPAGATATRCTRDQDASLADIVKAWGT